MEVILVLDLHRRAPHSIPDLSVWDLWWTK